MKTFRRIVCFFFGCKSICLFRLHWGQDRGQGSETTHWECERCGKTRHEQWDAEEGMLFNSVTNQLYGDKVTFAPCYMHKEWDT